MSSREEEEKRRRVEEYKMNAERERIRFYEEEEEAERREVDESVANSLKRIVIGKTSERRFLTEVIEIIKNYYHIDNYKKYMRYGEYQGHIDKLRDILREMGCVNFSEWEKRKNENSQKYGMNSSMAKLFELIPEKTIDVLKEQYGLQTEEIKEDKEVSSLFYASQLEYAVKLIGIVLR